MMESQTYTLPILSLESTLVFPNLAMPISVQKPASVQAVEAALASEHRMMALFSTRKSGEETSKDVDLYEFGTVATIQLIAKFDTKLQIIVHGVERISIVQILQKQPFLKAQVQPLSGDNSP